MGWMFSFELGPREALSVQQVSSQYHSLVQFATCIGVLFPVLIYIPKIIFICVYTLFIIPTWTDLGENVGMVSCTLWSTWYPFKALEQPVSMSERWVPLEPTKPEVEQDVLVLATWETNAGFKYPFQTSGTDLRCSSFSTSSSV